MDSRKVRFSEYWRAVPNPLLFVIAASLKLFHIPLPMGSGFPAAASAYYLPAEQFPDLVRMQFAPIAAEALQLGFELGWTYTLPSLGNITAYGASMPSRDGIMLLHIVFARIMNSQNLEEKISYGAISEFSDGRILATSSSKQEIDTPPGVEAAYLPKAPMHQIVAEHRERVQNHSMGMPRRLDRYDAETLVKKMNRNMEDFLIERGVWKPMTEAEMAALEKRWRPSG
jgi:hypothetical protein